MTQRDRDRLVVLKKVQKKRIRQAQAGAKLGITVRQVKRLLRRLKDEGDKALVHGLRGRSSNRKLTEEKREKIVRILSQEIYQGFGPTLASEYLAKKHRLEIGREALRQLMMKAGLWRGRRQKVEAVHPWRPRRSCRGELVAGARTLEEANRYLEQEFLPWWNQHLVVTPANPTDAHRPLGAEHDLASALSRVETRQVNNDYTIQLDGQFYQIEHGAIRAGLRGATVRIERRLDGSLAVRFRERYMTVTPCAKPAKAALPPQPVPGGPNKPPPPSPAMRASMNQFLKRPGPPLWVAAQIDPTRTTDELD
jgi:transposase